MAVTAPQALRDERASLDDQLAPLQSLTSQELLAKTKPAFAPSPTYSVAETTSIGGLPTIQSSALALQPAELAKLGQQGFVIVDRKRFPSFVYGYATLYAEDLPVYVSADSILFAVHRSYDNLLMSLERGALSPELQRLLSGMRARLASAELSALPAQARADADTYLTVAESLLKGVVVTPLAGGDAALVVKLVTQALAASGTQEVKLFGVKRLEDFSQFKPRGHYDDGDLLSRYFKAMMWLGRIDFRLLETQPDGLQTFHRAQLEAALVLRELMTPELRQHFGRIDRTITAFVGEHDYMQLSELDDLLADLGVASSAALTDVSDQRIAQAIVDGGYGTQRISSHIMFNQMREIGTLPLSSSFAFLGQRYVLDSHVFSNVVYDRVKQGQVKRMLPSPLDIGYAALGNDQAAQLLESELTTYPYAAELAGMRVLADAHPQEFWQASLYNLWLGAIRTLSPNAAMLASDAGGLPPVARSEAWGRRLLSTQLASWAELRHDTLLYAKQSYTAGASCEFPDAFVDPYPEFYRAVARYAEQGTALLAGLGLPAGTYPVVAGAQDYFVRLGSVAERLRGMAEHQLTGAPYTPEMLAFINDAVKVQQGCGSPAGSEGWYAKLFSASLDGVELDPTIADVHTQPTDEAGNLVGKVLHVATGMPRLMVVISEGCSGPRAYAGLASSYFERVTANFERLQDEPWAKEVQQAHPVDPSWLSDIVQR